MWNSRGHLVYSFPLTRSRFQLLHEPVTLSLRFLVTCCHESSCSYKRLQVWERHFKTAIHFSINTTEEKRVRLKLIPPSALNPITPTCTVEAISLNILVYTLAWLIVWLCDLDQPFLHSSSSLHCP